MQQAEDDALDKIVRDKDLEQDQSTPEGARFEGVTEGQDAAGIPRPSDDGDADESATDNYGAA